MEPIRIELGEWLDKQAFWEEVREELIDLVNASGGADGWEIMFRPVSANDESLPWVSDSDEDHSRYDLNENTKTLVICADVNLCEAKSRPREIADFLAGLVLPRED